MGFVKINKGIAAGFVLVAMLSGAAAASAATAPADSVDSAWIEETVVTGTRSEKTLAETPVRTELVSRQHIEALQAASLADACEFTPGLRSAQ